MTTFSHFGFQAVALSRDGPQHSARSYQNMLAFHAEILMQFLEGSRELFYVKPQTTVLLETYYNQSCDFIS